MTFIRRTQHSVSNDQSILHEVNANDNLVRNSAPDTEPVLSNRNSIIRPHTTLTSEFNQISKRIEQTTKQARGIIETARQRAGGQAYVSKLLLEQSGSGSKFESIVQQIDKRARGIKKTVQSRLMYQVEILRNSIRARRDQGAVTIRRLASVERTTDLSHPRVRTDASKLPNEVPKGIQDTLMSQKMKNGVAVDTKDPACQSVKKDIAAKPRRRIRMVKNEKRTIRKITHLAHKRPEASRPLETEAIQSDSRGSPPVGYTRLTTFNSSERLKPPELRIRAIASMTGRQKRFVRRQGPRARLLQPCKLNIIAYKSIAPIGQRIHQYKSQSEREGQSSLGTGSYGMNPRTRDRLSRKASRKTRMNRRNDKQAFKEALAKEVASWLGGG
ncbi:hypothetical protein ACN47E_002544 [Coniothyrium glycines]